MKKALTEAEVEKQLSKLSLEWTVVAGTTLMRSISCADFAEALAIVTIAGKEAEKLNHHPDISFGWGKVSIQITTHAVSALTKDDFALARAIEDSLEK